jgi:hypothetical protein
MRLRRQDMSNPRSSAILAAAVLIAVALPVSVAMSREVEPPPVIASRSDLSAVPAAIQPSALSTPAIPMTSETDDWTEGATQSAYMVVVGSLLIGIGSIVRRTV